jgi:hypothetical protein
LQASGGYVDAFGFPLQTPSGFANFVACPAPSAKGPSGASSALPYGPGGNPIALTYYGQIIDVVRLACNRFFVFPIHSHKPALLIHPSP